MNSNTLPVDLYTTARRGLSPVNHSKENRVLSPKEKCVITKQETTLKSLTESVPVLRPPEARVKQSSRVINLRKITEREVGVHDAYEDELLVAEVVDEIRDSSSSGLGRKARLGVFPPVRQHLSMVQQPLITSSSPRSDDEFLDDISLKSAPLTMEKEISLGVTEAVLVDSGGSSLVSTSRSSKSLTLRRPMSSSSRATSVPQEPIPDIPLPSHVPESQQDEARSNSNRKVYSRATSFPNEVPQEPIPDIPLPSHLPEPQKDAQRLNSYRTVYLRKQSMPSGGSSRSSGNLAQTVNESESHLPVLRGGEENSPASTVGFDGEGSRKPLSSNQIAADEIGGSSSADSLVRTHSSEDEVNVIHLPFTRQHSKLPGRSAESGNSRSANVEIDDTLLRNTNDKARSVFKMSIDRTTVVGSVVFPVSEALRRDTADSESSNGHSESSQIVPSVSRNDMVSQADQVERTIPRSDIGSELPVLKADSDCGSDQVVGRHIESVSNHVATPLWQCDIISESDQVDLPVSRNDIESQSNPVLGLISRGDSDSNLDPVEGTNSRGEIIEPPWQCDIISESDQREGTISRASNVVGLLSRGESDQVDLPVSRSDIESESNPVVGLLSRGDSDSNSGPVEGTDSRDELTSQTTHIVGPPWQCNIISQSDQREGTISRASNVVGLLSRGESDQFEGGIRRGGIGSESNSGGRGSRSCATSVSEYPHISRRDSLDSWGRFPQHQSVGIGDHSIKDRIHDHKAPPTSWVITRTYRHLDPALDQLAKKAEADLDKILLN